MRALAALWADEGGLSIAEYGIIAAGLALPMLAIGTLIATNAGTSLTTMTSGFNQIGLSPP